jgi:hypothetical protein
MNLSKMTPENWATQAKSHTEKMLECVENKDYFNALSLLNEVFCCLIQAVKAKYDVE